MQPTNPIIDLDTCPEPIDHDLDEFDWSEDLSLSRRDEEELLQSNAWLTDMHMSATCILLYRAKFQQINYEPHRYSFTETNAIYHRQCMQYINVHGNHWILCHIQPSSEHMHCTIYDSMIPSNRRLDPNIVKKLKRVLNIQGNLHYTYINVPQQLDGSSCGLFTIAYATDIAFNISPSQSNYNVPMMRFHLHTCLCLSVMTPFPTHSCI
jgi:hypothetical protein